MLTFLLFVCLVIACLYALAEIVYERDFPRHFCKYILLFAALLLCAASGVAQGLRYDSNITTSSTNVPVGAQAPVYTYPNSLVMVCAYPATPTTGATCTNTITTYTNQALTIANPTTLTSDFQGKFGFWLAQGTYTYSVVTPSNRYLGTYIISLGGSGSGSGSVTSVSGVNANGITVSVTNPTTTPAVTVGVDGTHVLPTNTGSSTTYLNGAGGYTTPAAGGLTSFQGRSTPAASLTTADVAGLGTLTNSTTGNAATAAALNHTPTLCGTGFAPTGILATGAATGCAPTGGSAAGSTGSIQYRTAGGAFGGSPATADATGNIAIPTGGLLNAPSSTFTPPANVSGVTVNINSGTGMFTEGITTTDTDSLTAGCSIKMFNNLGDNICIGQGGDATTRIDFQGGHVASTTSVSVITDGFVPNGTMCFKHTDGTNQTMMFTSCIVSGVITFTTAGRMVVTGDLQAATGHFGGSGAANLACTPANGACLGGSLTTSNVAFGTGAGTSPTSLTIAGTDANFQIGFTTGTTPSANATLFTLTFTATRNHSCYPTLDQSSNASSIYTTIAQFVHPDSTSVTAISFRTGGTALPASNGVLFNVSCP